MNTSELVPKITEAHSVSKMQAQGIVYSMLKGLTSARGRNRGRPFKMTAAWRGSPNQCAARRLRSPLRKLTYSLTKAVK